MSEPAVAQHDDHHDDGHHDGPSIGLYWWIWILLFVISGFSYWVDYAQLQGMLRWSLIIILMLVKAGFIVSIFMHLGYERKALIYALLVPPVLLLVLVWLMAVESDYTWLTRIVYFGEEAYPTPEPVIHAGH